MRLFLLILLAMFVSCKTTPTIDSVISYADFSSNKLSDPDTLVVCLEDFPRDLESFNEFLCVIMAKSDTTICLYDKHTGEKKLKMGTIGLGPNDVISPKFIKNNFNYKADGVKFYDMNIQKQFILSETGELMKFQYLDVNSKEKNNLSINENYAVGQPMDNIPLLFEINDKQNEEVIAVDLFPTLPEYYQEKMHSEYHRLYSTHPLCNFEKERVVLAMYYFDLIQIYDLEGKRLKAFTLDKDYNVEKTFSNMINGGDYVGCVQSYATIEKCYFRRDFIEGKSGDAKQCQIVELDWNGNSIRTFDLDRRIIGGFCVENDKIYCIHQTMINEDEAYIILSYDISKVS